MKESTKPIFANLSNRFVRAAVVRFLWSITCLTVLAAGIILPSGMLTSADAAAAMSMQRSGGIRESAFQQIQSLLDEKESRTPGQQKLSSQLLYSIKMHRKESIAAGVETLEIDVEIDSQLRTVVDITADVGGTLLNDLEVSGAEVISVFPQYNSIRARVPLDRLETIASLSEVRFIQPEQKGITSRVVNPPSRGASSTANRTLFPGFAKRASTVRTRLSETLRRLNQDGIVPSVGSVNSEGDITHKAALARGIFNVDGTGVKIGVLSDGVTNLAASQALGDLPLNVTVLPGQAGINDEGTAMLEIIHDLAPGAQLFFATGLSPGTSIADFAQNIRDLRAAGCDIIVDDIFYFAETPFQDGQSPGVVSNTNGGIVTQAVIDVTASGALYFSSAGNEGNLNDGTAGVWEGDFVDGGTIGFLPGGKVHNFGGGNQSDLITGAAPFAISLFWSDPLGGSQNDYDLFILDSASTTVLAASTGVQNGAQDPFEIVGPQPAGRRVVIFQKTGAANRFLHLNTFRGRLSMATNGTTHGHSQAADAFSCAATPALGAFPNPFNTANTVEIFSSDGPRRIFFNANSTPITPGNFSSTGGLLRQKPDITAADGVRITGVGGFGSGNPPRFFGTSASAPHAGAIAALLKSANPALTPIQIRMALINTAVDIEAPGVDRDSGAGIILAFEALQFIGANMFDVCLQDDSNPNNVLRWNSANGQYIFCCNGVTLAGTGIVGSKKGVLNLTHITSDRRVQGFLYMNQTKGSASLQMPSNQLPPCTISDSNVTNNTCTCQ